MRLSSQSRYSIEATSPITVTASAMPFTARVSASRMIVASVVKRAASCAGASRSMRARSAAHEMREHAPLQLADHQQHDLLHLRRSGNTAPPP